MSAHAEERAEDKRLIAAGTHFRCDTCRGVFKKGWSDEEAHAEEARLWGEVKPEDEAVICDVCFKRGMNSRV